MNLAQLQSALRMLRTKVANSIARAVIQNVDDSTKMQILQLGVLEGEDIDDCEHFQGFGFKSVPLPGAETVVVFPNGDRAHPLVVGSDDRRYRPIGWEGGEAGIYNAFDAIVRLREDGTIEAGSAAGAKVALATKADLDALAAMVASHIHTTTATPGPSATPGIISPPTTSPPSAAGTTRLKAE